LLSLTTLTPPADERLYLSDMGMGTYLGEADSATDEAVVDALLYSVTHGWNVIDTGEFLALLLPTLTSPEKDRMAQQQVYQDDYQKAVNLLIQRKTCCLGQLRSMPPKQ
jgi:hypothetical protein